MKFSQTESIGNIINSNKTQNAFYLECKNASVKIQQFNKSTVRLKIEKALDEDEFSYAVIAKANNFDFETTENEQFINVNFDEFSLEISKSPTRFVFKNKAGEIINEDEMAFGTSWIGTEVTTYKKLQANEKFVGLGEKAANLNLAGSAFTNWNTDAFMYSEGTDPLYATFPFYIGIHNGKYYGIFFDNSHKTQFNFGASNRRFASFSAEDGTMDYYFIYGKSIAEIVKEYTLLTGKIQMPPKWSLGLQQCRYSYYPAHEILSVAKNYRARKIPCDVVYYDIHYMDKYKVFTWDKTRFPDPKATNEALHQMDFKTVPIVDPGVKNEVGYEPFDSGNAQDLFVKYANGDLYEAEVWPGWCAFPDFTKAATRTWWANYFKQLKADGLDGFWNDMNEIASWGQSTPNNLIFDYEGKQATHKAARNVYGMQMSRATFEGAKKANPNERPFVLTRAAYSGSQRFTAVWTGDNTANDEHLLMGARMVCSLGLSGVAFAGYDVGGFIGETSPELFVRWIQQAAFAPFFRIHKMINEKDSEPWTYGEKAEAISKNFINLRYRLMPYIYQLFVEAANTGIPVNRSLAMVEPDNELIYNNLYQNQFMLGDSILVCPQKSTTEIAKIYLPKGNWHLLYNDKIFEGEKEHFLDCPMDILPVFVKAGAIVPEQNLKQFWNDKSDGVLRLHIYNSRKSTAYNYYEDDGISYDFEQGNFYKRSIEFDAKNKMVKFGKVEGNFSSEFKKVKVFYHNNEGTESYRFIEPLPAYDPWYNPGEFEYEIKKITIFEAEFTKEEFVVDLL